jgi:hypothetical protein
MSEDRQSKNGVIALGSDSTGISRLAIQAAERQIIRLYGEDTVPHVEVMEDRMKPSDLALVLGVMGINDISMIDSEYPAKQSKRLPPLELQQRTMDAAEAKRERRRLKRLRSTQEQR